MHHWQFTPIVAVYSWRRDNEIKEGLRIPVLAKISENKSALTTRQLGRKISDESTLGLNLGIKVKIYQSEGCECLYILLTTIL